jgi:hypothetical protein
MIYKSRKRKFEEAIKETFETFAGTALGTTQILLGRDETVQNPTHIRIHCQSQEPMTDADVPLLNFYVSGSITVQASMDDLTRDEYSTLEGLVESYVEQEPEALAGELNSSTIENFGCWEWHPLNSEDDIDEENRRYLSSYTFRGVIGHATY